MGVPPRDVDSDEARIGEGLDLIYGIDWVATLFLFFVTLPILLVSMVYVMIVDRGNPIFSQIRIGRNGKPYRIFKIRSMHHDHHGHARFCAHEDDRILPGGRFLRQTRIDELPQFWNVLAGHMALVGPRPEQPTFVECFLKEIPHYEERFQVKPGITGLAQVTQGYVDSLDGTRIKLSFDLKFIENRSLGMWFFIVFQTVKVVLFGQGAR
ncbi:sugar transferase [Mesoterricola silvestris]|nr:sugar transferase [Mesoterricola silvestris]